jgi:hypothetical protein
MKKNLLSLATAFAFVVLSLSTFAQGTGNQPAGGLVYAPDGNIYGAYTKTSADLRRPSTIYRYTPGSSTIDPIFRLEDHVLEVHVVDSGYIYGTAINYHPLALHQRYQSRVFRLKIDGTEFRILRSAYISSWGAHESLIIVNDFLYGILPGGWFHEPGVVFRINKNDGSDYSIVEYFPTASERATTLLPHYSWPREYEGSGGDLVGFWTTTTAGGTFGKGSAVGRDFDGVPNRRPLNLEGFQGDFYDGQGPVALTHWYTKEVLAITQRGGKYNEGTIFLLNPHSDIPIFDFVAPYGRPFGKPFWNDSTMTLYGLGGDFDNNTGFIYSIGPSNGLEGATPIATFGPSSFVNRVTSVVSYNHVIYGTSRITGSDSENGSLFAINEDGTQERVIFKFDDSYSRLLDPADNYSEASVTPSLRVLNGLEGVTNYRIEICENSDFTGTVHVVNSADGLGKINTPVLKYSTKYYARVKTNLIDDYGTVTTFTTHAPEKYSFVSSPVNGATNVPFNGLKATANIVYGATLYTIELNTSADFTGTSIVRSSAVANQRTLTFDGLQPSTTYYSRTKTNFPSDWGPTRSFTTAATAPPPAFVAEMNELKVYPNPFEHNFIVEPDESQELSVTLIDLTGRELVKTQVIQQPTTLGDQLVPGIYLLRINENGRTSVRRMVKK